MASIVQAAAFSTERMLTTQMLLPAIASASPLLSGLAGRASVIASRLPFQSTPNLALATTIIGAHLTPLSPASSLGLLLRGGAIPEVVEEVVLKNFSGDAVAFFSSVRISATFFAGSSLAAIFTLKNEAFDLASTVERHKMSRLERRTIKFYHLMSVMAFVLSINTIATCTTACTSVLHRGINPVAESPYRFLTNEFHYEFIMTRWSFLVSIFCFLGMLTSRLLIEFGLLEYNGGENDRTKREVAILTVSSIIALAASMMSYVNENLWCWNSLAGMTFYLAKVCFLTM